MKHSFKGNYYPITILQLFVPLLLLWLSRFAFAIYNSSLLGNPSIGHVFQLTIGGLRFDLCAWAYFNIPFILLRFLPFNFVQNKRYLLATNIIYTLANSAMLILALGDIPFYRFTGSRLRAGAITEMFQDPNMAGIIISYISSYWWAFLVGVLVIGLIAATAFLLKPAGGLITLRNSATTYSARSALLLIAGFLTFSAMRGQLGPGRPLSIADAVWYANTPTDTNIVLNTPFCILRSSTGAGKIEEVTFMNEAELNRLRNSVHTPSWPADSFTHKNVMLITVESGSLHFLDRYNNVPGSQPRQLMPFLDSLASVSLVNTHVLATGRRSVEGITAIYGGFPTFGDMIYMSSPYNANTVDSHARLLKAEGYSTRFYFGGNHGSYSIDALLKAMGYDSVADRDTYGDDSEYNGHWGIYDHAMARYAANDLENLTEPFAAGWFTLDLHVPFNVPQHWRSDGYKNAEAGPLRSAEYTDRALRRFFELARTKPWYKNTIFIITGDHGSRDFKDTAYDTPYIQPHVMFIVYTPDGSIAPAEITDRYMTQFDIGPTILSLLHYAKPYVAVGSPMTDDTVPHYAIGFFNGQYQLTGPRYTITLTADCKGIDKVFSTAQDPLAKTPVADYDHTEVDAMLRFAQAFLQDYTQRLNANTLHI
ncbi:MAG: LTA synthase family protein [Bacteroides sp.]|nr:LTA synthase family protein [Bacteroides sp.]